MIYGNEDYAMLLKQIIKDELRHDLYELTVEHAKEMGVHILGEKPVYLLERNRPREDEESKLYRVENYEPTTKAGADRAIKIVGKGFNPTLYSLVWKTPTPEGEELEKYMMEYYPGCNSIINFNKDVLLRRMLADPNGLVAIKPSDIPNDETEKLQPVTMVYGSSALWYYDRDHYLLCVREPSKQDKDQWFEFEYYDKTQYINFRARYDEADKQIIIEELIPPYRHNGGKIPAWFTGGESKALDNGKIIYQSFFSAALPHWNKAVKHDSDLMASIIAHIFPQKYEVAEECAYAMELEGLRYSCQGGILKYPGSKRGEIQSMECPQCHGAGLVSVKGPLQTYLFNKEKLSSEGSPLPIAPVGYIDVPIDSTRFLDEYVDKMNQKAMAAINMDIEEKIGENQSGVAKAIDRTAQNDTIFDIHSRIWDVHTQNEFYFVNMYRNGVYVESVGKEGDQKFLPEINKPTKFDLLSTSELIYNFDVSKKSGLDRNILRTQAINIIKSENGSSPDMKNYLIALIELDPLYSFTADDIDRGVNKGVIRKVDWAIHDNIKAFVDRALEENAEFLSMKRSEKLVILEGFANELIEAEKPRIDEAMMQVNAFNDAA